MINKEKNIFPISLFKTLGLWRLQAGHRTFSLEYHETYEPYLYIICEAFRAYITNTNYSDKTNIESHNYLRSFYDIWFIERKYWRFNSQICWHTQGRECSLFDFALSRGLCKKIMLIGSIWQIIVCVMKQRFITGVV